MQSLLIYIEYELNILTTNHNSQVNAYVAWNTTLSHLKFRTLQKITVSTTHKTVSKTMADFYKKWCKFNNGRTNTTYIASIDLQSEQKKRKKKSRLIRNVKREIRKERMGWRTSGFLGLPPRLGSAIASGRRISPWIHIKEEIETRTKRRSSSGRGRREEKTRCGYRKGRLFRPREARTVGVERPLPG